MVFLHLKRAAVVVSLFALLLTARPAWAHPMGNFAICHYTRLRAEPQGLVVRYILDLAEIPTLGEKPLLDRDRDGSVSDEERSAYLVAKTPELLAGLSLQVDGRILSLSQAAGEVKIVPGAAGLDTMKIILDFQVSLPESTRVHSVSYRDRNYEARAGWKEIVVVAAPGVRLKDGTVPAVERSRELSAYPPDGVPPQETEARFTVVVDESAPASNAARSADSSGAPAVPSSTPRDAFTQAIAHRELEPGLIVTGLLIAFAFGALHALSPGHGKAMVAAYLVGSRGTARHTVFLGVVVTVTHTLGVFALGLATLLASSYVLPEQLYPILSILSGLIICGVGLRLLYVRIRRLLRGPRARTGQPHSHEHLPDGPVTVRSLLALGISGGLIPCPSALVVLLAAVALHRIAYGMLLIGAFSMGLAAVLVLLGLLVVHARQWLDGSPTSAALLRRIPVASAAVITCIGIALVVRAFEAGMP